MTHRWIVHHALSELGGGQQEGSVEAQKLQAKRALQQLVQAQAKGLNADQVGGDVGNIMRYAQAEIAEMVLTVWVLNTNEAAMLPLVLFVSHQRRDSHAMPFVKHSSVNCE